MGKTKKETNVAVYEVTNDQARPFLLAAYTRDADISVDAEYEMVKQLVKEVRKRRWAISTIVITTTDDGLYGELWGVTE